MNFRYRMPVRLAASAVAVLSGCSACGFQPVAAALGAPAVPAHAVCAFLDPSYCANPSKRPSVETCRKAIKLLTQYSRLYEKAKKRPLPKKLREKLDRKRREATITSHDLPGALQREFPRELEGWTLEQIREVCSRPVAV